MNYSSDHPDGFFARFASTLPPPGAVHIGSAAIAASAMLWIFRQPGGGDFPTNLFLDLACAAIVAAWAIRILIALLNRRHPEKLSAHRLRWLSIPTIFIILFIAVGTGLPRKVCFAFSRSAFDRAAAQVTSGTSVRVPSWIGLYRIDRVEPLPGGVRFTTNQPSFFNAGGFAYSPTGAPVASPRETYTPISNGWYTYYFND